MEQPKEEEQYVLDEYPDEDNEKIKPMYSCYFCGKRSEVEMKSMRLLELGDVEVFVCQGLSA